MDTKLRIIVLLFPLIILSCASKERIVVNHKDFVFYNSIVVNAEFDSVLDAVKEVFSQKGGDQETKFVNSKLNKIFTESMPSFDISEISIDSWSDKYFRVLYEGNCSFKNKCFVGDIVYFQSRKSSIFSYRGEPVEIIGNHKILVVKYDNNKTRISIFGQNLTLKGIGINCCAMHSGLLPYQGTVRVENERAEQYRLIMFIQTWLDNKKIDYIETLNEKFEFVRKN